MIHIVLAKEKKIVRFSGKRISYRNVNVYQQFLYTIRNLISKLAPNRLTNVKVIDLEGFFWDRPFAGKLFKSIMMFKKSNSISIHGSRRLLMQLEINQPISLTICCFCFAAMVLGELVQFPV